VKASDEQRVDNCKVPIELHDAKSRPDEWRDGASTTMFINCGPSTAQPVAVFNFELIAQRVRLRRHRNCSNNYQPDKDRSGHDIHIQVLEALNACCHDCRYGQKAPNNNKRDKGFQCEHQRWALNSPKKKHLAVVQLRLRSSAVPGR
jgi:hypothetical protein